MIDLEKQHNDKMSLSYLNFILNMVKNESYKFIDINKIEVPNSTYLTDEQKDDVYFRYRLKMEYQIGDDSDFNNSATCKIELKLKKIKFGRKYKFNLIIHRQRYGFSYDVDELFSHRTIMKKNIDFVELYNLITKKIKEKQIAEKEAKVIAEEKKKNQEKEAEKIRINHKINRDNENYEEIIPLKYKRLSKINNLMTHDTKGES